MPGLDVSDRIRLTIGLPADVRMRVAGHQDLIAGGDPGHRSDLA